MKNHDFLLEIGCEELPAKLLLHFTNIIRDNLQTAFKKLHLLINPDTIKIFATPRRIGILIKDLPDSQQDMIIKKTGPAITAPVQAKNGFAKSCEAYPNDLIPENNYWVYTFKKTGEKTEDLLPTIITQALTQITGIKTMQWGNCPTAFLRPVKWLMIVYGQKLIPLELFGKKSTRHTYGHRFLAPHKLELTDPANYEDLLLEDGFVQPNFEARKNTIEKNIHALAAKHHYKAIINPDLLNEVNGLVEWPVILWGEFPKSFLSLPPEVVILSLEHHQKCFAVLDNQNCLVPYFIIVSNLKTSNPDVIINGNEHVVNARLSDALFFYTQDKKDNFESRFELLKHITFQHKLGSIADKVERMAVLAKKIAVLMQVNPLRAERAALLCKNDLTTLMVNEFPELQGVMGEYYIKHERINPERDEIAIASREHYLPRFSGDVLPHLALSCVIALADRIDTLESLFSLQGPPSGDKDPFGLRRAALGIIRIIIEKNLSGLLLSDLITRADVREFIIDRLPSYYSNTNKTLLLSILTVQQDNLYDIHERVLALEQFCASSESYQLIEANKRVKNILKKYESNSTNHNPPDLNLFEFPAEKKLYQAIVDFPEYPDPSKNYSAILNALLLLNPVITDFFNAVMIEVDNEKIKLNRINVLFLLKKLLLTVSDLSCLN